MDRFLPFLLEKPLVGPVVWIASSMDDVWRRSQSTFRQVQDVVVDPNTYLPTEETSIPEDKLDNHGKRVDDPDVSDRQTAHTMMDEIIQQTKLHLY